MNQTYLAFGLIFVQLLGLRVHGPFILEYGRIVFGGHHLDITGFAVGQNLVDTSRGIAAHILHLQTAIGDGFAFVIDLDDVEGVAHRQFLLGIQRAGDGFAAIVCHAKVERIELLEES